MKLSVNVKTSGTVVLDETDRLLEGFQKETNRILSFLPRQEKRQTLLFSATIPRRLKATIGDILPPDYFLADCINDFDLDTQTNRRVGQSYFVLPSMD